MISGRGGAEAGQILSVKGCAVGDFPLLDRGEAAERGWRPQGRG